MSSNSKTQRRVEEGVTLATELVAIYDDVRAFHEAYFADALNDGGAHAIVDGDFTAGLDYLTAADFVSMMTVFESITTLLEADGRIGALRKASFGGKR